MRDLTIAVRSCKLDARYPVYDTTIEQFEGRLKLPEGRHQCQMSWEKSTLDTCMLLCSFYQKITSR